MPRGGVGTALAWAPTCVDQLGIANALELGVAANTVGLIAARVIGGPIARYRMALMGLDRWELEGLLVFIGVVMLLRTLLSVAFTLEPSRR
jgi:Na+/glutamate symporter